MTTCENCRAKTNPQSWELFDYCAICSKNLCDGCMELGCCGHVPAKSGAEEDC
jgi:hypothetical protein